MSNTQPSTTFDVVVVGAGLGGLYALYRMRELGLSTRVLEAGNDVGGTWYWNRYPGCRCDVESLEYSYSFDDQLQQDWSWPERYSTQPQILKYIEHVADRFDLRRDVDFNTRVDKALFDEATNRWRIETQTGRTLHARFCIMATGNLSTPQVPPFEGLDEFQGAWYHTGMWPQEGVDFSGQRLAVIGTGSSGVQMIPIVARQAKHLHVFQRTPNFVLPAQNGPMDRERERAQKANYPALRKAAYFTPFGIAGYPPPTCSALQVTPQQRHAAYESKWQEGGTISFLYAYTDLLTNQAANDTAAEFVRDKIRSIVKDPHVAEALLPFDHPIGTKRLILDTGYYETYNRSNVTLVNARKTPIERITATGIETTDAHYEFDAIAFATGFDAMTGAMKNIDIRGVGGASVRERWQDGPHTYLGIMLADMPNLFMITGPGSPGVKSQMILSIEQHVHFISDCLAHMQREGLARVDALAQAEQAWDAHVAEVAHSTLYPKANSWYMGANVPGKARVFMPYVGGVEAYAKRCQEVIDKGFTGFRFSRADAQDKVA